MKSKEEIIDVVFIEDDVYDWELTMDALRENNPGLVVKWLRDGQEALDYFLADADNWGGRLPKLILLDLKLPKVSGLDILLEIRKTETLNSVPIVVLTSSAEDADVSRAYQNGANSFLTKPVAHDQFTEVIKNLGVYWLLTNRT